MEAFFFFGSVRGVIFYCSGVIALCLSPPPFLMLADKQTEVPLR